MTGMVAWYKADVGVLQNTYAPSYNGSYVTYWQDQSGNGNTATAGAWADYVTGAAPSGGPLVAFDNSPSIGFAAAVTLSTPYTVLCVFSTFSSSGPYRAVAGGLTDWLLGPYNGHIACKAGGWVCQSAGPAVVSGQLYRVATTNSGTASTFAVDGTDHTVDGTQVSAPGVVYFGTGGSTAEGFYHGRMAECVIYNRVLNSTELSDANTYFQTRWLTVPTVSPGAFMVHQSVLGSGIY